jgi:hypothetical protein
VLGLGDQRQVQGDDVARLTEGRKVDELYIRNVGDVGVVSDHAKAERQSSRCNSPPDIAETDQAQYLAAKARHRLEQRPIPSTALDAVAQRRDLPHRCQQERQRMVCHLVGTDRGHVDDRDSLPFGGSEIDVIEANAARDKHAT